MKLNRFTISAALVLVLSVSATAQSILPNFGGDRSGTSGFQFAKIIVDARSASMGSSNMADAFDASSLYWNPALASRMESSEFMAGHTVYFADINMEYLSYVQRKGKFAFGASVQYLNSGDIKETTEFQPFGTGRTFRTIHMNVGLTASHAITELFSYGITVRYLMERIEEVEIKTGAIDFGFFYTVGETGLRFAVGINNFGLDTSPSGTTIRETTQGNEEVSDFADVSLPTRFNIAAAYDAFENEQNKLVITGQITNPSDNSERVGLGVEYGFMKQFFLRSGYEFGREERIIPSFGAGIKVPFAGRSFSADYGYTQFDRLGTVHRVALRVAL
ncbi:PorV/PorQ family protein [Balneola sp. MJW-20]|uniref:PorV/PorQ family protein n=1 Tax=Gracilimonas aurantiaca TaxID=3234185 RepID=UPI0034667336